MSVHLRCYFYIPDDRASILVNGKASKHAPVPQKNLPNLPPARTVSDSTNMSNGENAGCSQTLVWGPRGSAMKSYLAFIGGAAHKYKLVKQR